MFHRHVHHHVHYYNDAEEQQQPPLAISGQMGQQMSKLVQVLMVLHGSIDFMDRYIVVEVVTDYWDSCSCTVDFSNGLLHKASTRACRAAAQGGD